MKENVSGCFFWTQCIHNTQAPTWIELYRELRLFPHLQTLQARRTVTHAHRQSLSLSLSLSIIYIYDRVPLSADRVRVFIVCLSARLSLCLFLYCHTQSLSHIFSSLLTKCIYFSLKFFPLPKNIAALLCIYMLYMYIYIYIMYIWFSFGNLREIQTFAWYIGLYFSRFETLSILTINLIWDAHWV